jgi:hypothetical protein
MLCTSRKRVFDRNGGFCRLKYNFVCHHQNSIILGSKKTNFNFILYMYILLFASIFLRKPNIFLGLAISTSK